MYPTIDSYHSPRKHEVLARSMRKIERTLDTVLRSLGNPSTVSAMLSRSPSPVGLTAREAASQQIVATRELMDSCDDSPPQSPQEPAAQGGSPKLHSLPNDTLNPLGLLAETSLATRKSNAEHHGTLYPRPFDETGAPKVGVASEVYFKPGQSPDPEPTGGAQRSHQGPINILPLRRLYIENRVQPEMLNFTSTEDVLALFNMCASHSYPCVFGCVDDPSFLKLLRSHECQTPSTAPDKRPFD